MIARPQRRSLTSPTSGGRSVGIVRWRTKPRKFFGCLSIICVVSNFRSSSNENLYKDMYIYIYIYICVTEIKFV
jgi:hypothetical protein